MNLNWASQLDLNIYEAESRVFTFYYECGIVCQRVNTNISLTLSECWASMSDTEPALLQCCDCQQDGWMLSIDVASFLQRHQAPPPANHLKAAPQSFMIGVCDGYAANASWLVLVTATEAA